VGKLSKLGWGIRGYNGRWFGEAENRGYPLHAQPCGEILNLFRLARDGKAFGGDEEKELVDLQARSELSAVIKESRGVSLQMFNLIRRRIPNRVDEDLL
jgi:hypothetical protein